MYRYSGEYLNILPSGLSSTIYTEKRVNSLLRMSRAQTIDAEPLSVRFPHKFMQMAPGRVGLIRLQSRAALAANRVWDWDTSQSNIRCFIALMGWVRLATIETALANSTTALLAVVAGLTSH